MGEETSLTETFWFMLVLWVIFLAFGFRYRNEYMIKTSAGLIGVLFGLLVMTETTITLQVSGFALVLFNIYVLGSALLVEGGK